MSDQYVASKLSDRACRSIGPPAQAPPVPRRPSAERTSWNQSADDKCGNSVRPIQISYSNHQKSLVPAARDYRATARDPRHYSVAIPIFSRGGDPRGRDAGAGKSTEMLSPARPLRGQLGTRHRGRRSRRLAGLLRGPLDRRRVRRMHGQSRPRGTCGRLRAENCRALSAEHRD